MRTLIQLVGIAYLGSIVAGCAVERVVETRCEPAICDGAYEATCCEVLRDGRAVCHCAPYGECRKMP